MTENDIKSLFKGLQQSILEAQSEIEEQHAKTIFNTYFENEGTPKMIELEIGGKKTSVPLFTLLPHNSLKMSEVQLEMDVKLDKDSNSLLNRVLFNTKTNAHLSIKFTGDKMPEGIARINNMLTKF